MPQGGGDGEGCERRGGAGGRREGVEVASTIAAKHHASTRNILDRKTKSVKLNGTVVVTSKLTHGKEVTNKRGND